MPHYINLAEFYISIPHPTHPPQKMSSSPTLSLHHHFSQPNSFNHDHTEGKFSVRHTFPFPLHSGSPICRNGNDLTATTTLEKAVSFQMTKSY
jgi:hypothetical protein